MPRPPAPYAADRENEARGGKRAGRTAEGGTEMASTSSTLAAGMAFTRQGGNGKGTKGRVAGLVATAALGLSLLSGLAFSQARPQFVPAAALSRASGTDR